MAETRAVTLAHTHETPGAPGWIRPPTAVAMGGRCATRTSLTRPSLLLSGALLLGLSVSVASLPRAPADRLLEQNVMSLSCPCLIA